MAACWPTRWLTARPDFVDAALAYVRFALDHPGHYAVMFDRSLVDPEDPELKAAQDAAGAELARGVGTLERPTGQGGSTKCRSCGVVVGARVCLLRLNEAIDTDDDPMAAVQRIALMLFDG